MVKIPILMLEDTHFMSKCFTRYHLALFLEIQFLNKMAFWGDKRKMNRIAFALFQNFQLSSFNWSSSTRYFKFQQSCFTFLLLSRFNKRKKKKCKRYPMGFALIYFIYYFLVLAKFMESSKVVTREVTNILKSTKLSGLLH